MTKLDRMLLVLASVAALSHLPTTSSFTENRSPAGGTCCPAFAGDLLKSDRKGSAPSPRAKIGTLTRQSMHTIFTEISNSRTADDGLLNNPHSRPLAMAANQQNATARAKNANASDDKPGRPLRIICFGAHPDDVEFVCGGTGAKWAKLGHRVKFVSVTNGDIGHWNMAGGPLAQRRSTEVKKADAILGVESEVLDIHDGELMPTLENRKKITRLIREWQADVVMSHRPWDYHPDHRYVGVLVQDAAFMVTVPFFCPDTPPLKQNPVFFYYADRFQKPYPFQADVAVDIGDTWDAKIRACHELASQVYEGGASGSEEYLSQVPKGDEARLQWLKDVRLGRLKDFALKYRQALERWYGEERGRKVEQVEAFEICEYGRQPSPEELRKLFPFFD